jgi:hypothetical protein
MSKTRTANHAAMPTRSHARWGGRLVLFRAFGIGILGLFRISDFKHARTVRACYDRRLYRPIERVFHRAFGVIGAGPVGSQSQTGLGRFRLERLAGLERFVLTK